nr:ddb1 and cul4 associated factor 7 [Polyrhizophydium stewartii]
MWSPYTGLGPDLLATSGDFLRIWELVTPDEAMDVELERPEGGFVGAPAFEERQLIPRGSLVNMRRSKKDYSAPLTSFDWNDTDPSLCVTSSVDTTCTVWDVQAQQAKTQLIAHDKEVFDVAFSKGVHVFASVGADGSVRMFDLRSLDHSTIIYETPSGTSPSGGVGRPSSLMRLAWNKLDTNYLATFQQDSNAVLILDVRVPAVPVTELHGHAANVSSIAWAPHSSKHICTTSDDCNALVWDITHMPKHKRIRDPVLAYQAPAEINNLSWSTVLTDFVAISHGRQVQALKI